MTVTPITAAQPAASTLARFNELRLQATALLLEASRLPSLPALHRLQAEASGGLAGMTLHRIHGQAGVDDADALRADLEIIARKVDPLIAEVGAITASEFNKIDRTQFTDVLANAIADGPVPELTLASERAAQDRAEGQYDRRNSGSHRARLAQEA